METLLIVFAVIFTIFIPLAYFSFVGKSKKNRLSDLKQYGKVIESIITGIHNEAPLMGNNVILCRIYAESKIDNILYRFVSGKLYPKDCKQLNIGDDVKVLINPQNPKDYFFEYDPLNMDY